MGEQENNEIKILIDALKYTSNIIVDLTNKLTIQEEKISQLETKLIKTQKLSMENNLKLKTIDINKLNKILSSSKKYNINNDNYNNDNYNIDNDNGVDDNDSDKISKYVIEKKKNSQEYASQYNVQNKLSSIAGDKTKIDKLIGSIVKRKNDLNQLINDNKEKDIVGEYEYTKNNKKNNENSGLDFTIKTATNKSNFDESKTNYERNGMGSGINHEKEEENITNAQNNDLNKANNILKQIRRRANIKRM